MSDEIIIPRNDKYIREEIPRKKIPYIIIDKPYDSNPAKHYSVKVSLN